MAAVAVDAPGALAYVARVALRALFRKVVVAPAWEALVASALALLPMMAHIAPVVVGTQAWMASAADRWAVWWALCLWLV